MKKLALIVCALLLPAAFIQAEDTLKNLSTLVIVPQTLPTGHLLESPNDPSQWVITSIPAPDPSPQKATTAPNPAPKAAVLTITKSGKIFLVESIAADGAKMTRWKQEQFQATYSAGATTPLIGYNEGSAYYFDFSKSEFPECSWISAHNYVGMTKLGTNDAMVFKARVSTRGARMALLSGLHPNPSEAIAVIDLATRRPIMLQVDNELLTYQFNPGAQAVALPPEVQQAFDAQRQRIVRAMGVPPS